MITISDITRAYDNIRPFIHRTPLIYSSSLSLITGAEVYLKAENLQKTGSFKVRGAVNKMTGIKAHKVIAASMGNHAQGVAYAASRLGLRAEIVMPSNASIVKEEAARGYGAEVALHGKDFNDALEYARARKGCIFIHPFDDEEVIAGQGTVGLEIIEDLKDIDFILAPVGGGGLISGVAVAVKNASPETKVIGVQAESAPSAYISFKERKISVKPPVATLADGIAVGRVGEKTFDIMMSLVDDMLVAREESIAQAILLFLERKKLVVEGAGAVGLAALIENRERFAGKRAVLIVSGGNIDSTVIDKIIHKGLVSSGRVGVFEVTVEDIPGSLHSLTGLIASDRGNILDVSHERLAGDLPVGKTRVIFTIETKGEAHLIELLNHLSSNGFEVLRRM